MKKIIRITTVPISLKKLLEGQHRFMKDQGFDVIGVSSMGKELVEVASNEGIRTESVEMTRTISPVKDLKSVWQLYKLFKREKPQIVHTHTPKAGTVGMMAAWLARVPIRLHTVAGMPLMEASGLKRLLLNMVEKITYSFATAIYPNSRGLYDFIIQQEFTHFRKLKVIGNGSSNGIDTQHFNLNHFTDLHNNSLRTSLGIASDDFVFVFVGRLVKDKGINELVWAFNKLKLTVSEKRWFNGSIKLLLIGDFERNLDPLNPDTEQEINVNNDIVFTGYQQDVRPYLAISDCLAFPSYREGFPNVVMQAGAMGLPSIVSDINGCNEIIVEGKNGTIIPPKNVEALRQAMERMMDDGEYYARLKENTRLLITSRYEQQVVWNALLEEYKRLLKWRIR